MTSSGTYAFSISNGEAIISAFERIQIRLPQLRQEHWRTARVEMNLLFAEWSNKQVNIWKTELLQITLVDGTRTYSLPTRVVMVLDAYLTSDDATTDQNDRYIIPISRTDYASYASKFTAGLPTSYYFERVLTPTMTVWPVIDASGYVINYYACVQVQDAALTGGQTPDVPYLWTDALVAGLSHRLARTYAPQMEAQRKTDAMESWTVAAAQNIENVGVKIAPTLGAYYR